MSSVLFSRCRVFDGRRADLIETLDVLVEDGRIKELSDRPIRATADRTIPVNGRTLMPGLIDAHWHVVAADVKSHCPCLGRDGAKTQTRSLPGRRAHPGHARAMCR